MSSFRTILTSTDDLLLYLHRSKTLTTVASQERKTQKLKVPPPSLEHTALDVCGPHPTIWGESVKTFLYFCCNCWKRFSFHTFFFLGSFFLNLIFKCDVLSVLGAERCQMITWKGEEKMFKNVQKSFLQSTGQITVWFVFKWVNKGVTGIKLFSVFLLNQ